MATEFIRVFARVRPSRTGGITTVASSGKLISTNNSQFTFDGGFGAASQQEDIFEQVGKRIVDGAVDGINGTIFAYGQTGSGKTFTMVGPDNNGDFQLDGESRGLVPRCIGTLFDKLAEEKLKKGDCLKYEVKCSFVEIYNESIRDLLTYSRTNVNLRVGERVMLDGAANEHVTSEVDAVRLLQAGLRQRQVGSTAMNDVSSRSHAIFIIDVIIEESEGNVESRRESRICLVDLAGSERQAATQSAGQRLKEAGQINKSLSTLALVIRKLSDGSGGHVPFRDSKLTLLLKESIGGSSRTAVIVALHPDLEQERETLSTLAFADNVKKIKNKTTVNKTVSGESAAALKERIIALEALLEREKASTCTVREEAEERYRQLEARIANEANLATPRKKARRKTSQHEMSAQKIAVQARLWDMDEMETENVAPAPVNEVEKKLAEALEENETQRRVNEEQQRKQDEMNQDMEKISRSLAEAEAALKTKERALVKKKSLAEHLQKLNDELIKKKTEMENVLMAKDTEVQQLKNDLSNRIEKNDLTECLQKVNDELKKKATEAESALSAKDAEIQDLRDTVQEKEDLVKKLKESEATLKNELTNVVESRNTRSKVGYVQKIVSERDELKAELDELKKAQKRKK